MTPPRPGTIYVGVAGWALRKEHQHLFPEGQSHLARYAGRLSAVEINSSFYKPHRPATYRRWAETTPDHFRFAVKAPREITHYQRLRASGASLERFLKEATGLGQKLGVVLVQLPPQLPLDGNTADTFFSAFRERFTGAIVCEPRHETWFTEDADALLKRHKIGRVAADPPRAIADGRPGGELSTIYYRLHGSPTIYYSPYSDEAIASTAARLVEWSRRAAQTWCVFDNTAEGHATTNALDLAARLEQQVS